MMRTPWLYLMLLLCSATAVQAQQWPGYPYGSYYQPRAYYPYGYGGGMPYYPSQGGYSPYYPPQPTTSATLMARPSSQPVVMYPQSPVPTPQPSPPVGMYSPPVDNQSVPETPLLQRIVKAVAPASAIPSEDGPPIQFHRPCKEAFWVTGDFLGTVITPMRLASPLVTTGSVNNAHPGAIGQPSTAVLFGDQNVNFNIFAGFNLETGVFLDQENHYSLEWRGFLLLPNKQTYNIASDAGGNPLITRPVFATDLNGERVFLTSFPGQFAGALAIDFKSVMGGTEFNARYHAYSHERLHSDFLVGVRYLRLSESMTIRDNVTAINGSAIPFPPPAGPNFPAYTDVDSFATTNQFFGTQVGGRLAWENYWINASIFAKLGLGATLERVNINGSTTFLSPGGNVTENGGLLALPSNIGNHSRTVFGIVPEMGINLGVNLTDHIRLNLGYSGLLWNKVVRPGMQYDHDVNTALAPSGNFGAANVTGTIAPVFRVQDEFFWAQSVNVGIEFHY